MTLGRVRQLSVLLRLLDDGGVERLMLADLLQMAAWEERHACHT